MRGERIERAPSRKLKLLFWVVLGALSVFFAEVAAGSHMFPFFDVWGIIGVFPLYTLHIIVLASVVFRFSKARLYTLFLAGTIFGLYEAYITKVLWNPPWGPSMLPVAGVALIEILVLVFFWHAFMSFVIPVFVGESVLTRSREVTNGLPDRIRKKFKSKRKTYTLLALLALFAATTQAANSPTPLHSLASGLSTTAVLIVLIYLWREKTPGKHYSIRQLLPSGKELVVLLALLILLYMIEGAMLRMEFLPGLGPQAIIWGFYAVLLSLLSLSLRRSRKVALPGAFGTPVKFSWKAVFALALLFSLATSGITLVFGAARGVIPFFIFIGGGAFGVFFLLLAIRDLLGKPD